jgi:RNA polymerase sigma factor (sigma-70 family)
LFPVSRRGGNIPVETMSEPDNRLIAEFNARRSEEAFAALVRQHVNLVFATALRQVGDAGAAEEITQNVFVALAQAASKLGSHPTIAGWLHQTALNKSREWLRSELRRRRREQVAVNLDLARAEGDSVWSSLVPLLDEALLELREPDRLAVILHFMEGQTFQEVGSALGIGEDTARKRVHRCLGQLTQFFRRRGFAVPALVAGAPLFTLSSHATPAGLAASATTAGLAAVHSAATSTLTLIKGALKIMAWTKAKTVIVASVAAILAISTATVVVKRVIQMRMDDSSIADSFFNPTNLWRAPSNVLILRQTHFTGQDSAMTAMRTRAGGKQEERILGRNQSIGQIFEMANGLAETETRIVLPVDLPQFNFDYLITLPGSQENQLNALQAAIKKKLGLIGRFETLETNVLLLKLITPGLTGLKPHPANGNAGVTVTAGRIHAVGQSTAYLTTTLEYALKLPVLDQTGLGGKRYDYVLDEGLFDGTTDGEKVKEFVRDEFGLELVPTNMPIEMLVVERVKN